MGWKGTVGTYGALARSAHRQSERTRKDLERRQKELGKLAAREQAALEADIYANCLDVLQSVHKQCEGPVDWAALLDPVSIEAPVQSDVSERRAQQRLADYKPGLLARTLVRTDQRRSALEGEVEAGRRDDEERYDRELAAYRSSIERSEQLRRIAVGVLAGDPSVYLYAIREADSYSDIAS